MSVTGLNRFFRMPKGCENISVGQFRKFKVIEQSSGHKRNTISYWKPLKLVTLCVTLWAIMHHDEVSDLTHNAIHF